MTALLSSRLLKNKIPITEKDFYNQVNFSESLTNTDNMIFYKSSIALAISAMLLIVSCNPQQQKTDKSSNAIDTAAYLQKGDSISAIVQKVLLANVMQAMKSGGPVYAVSFCNEQAMPLTDSLAKAHNCLIQRVSDKYRNPTNKLSVQDQEIWTKMASATTATISGSENGQIVFYKPIKIAMPACLTCHGTAGKEMDPKTFEIIKQKYPDDLATGYKEGDLRGLWKITFLNE
jgi:hypothetical protein